MVAHGDSRSVPIDESKQAKVNQQQDLFDMFYEGLWAPPAYIQTVDTEERKGKIIAESRDPTLDRLLDLAWLDIKISGTKFLQAVTINERVDSLILKGKNDKIAGLEIADAIVTPIARAVLRRQSRIDINIIKDKMRNNHMGEITGYGLVVLPK